MKLNKLRLTDFRNYKRKTFAFSKDVTLFVGENARGKTNILEAVNLLATGDSFRAEKVEQMINWNAEVGHVEARVDSGEDEVELRVTLTRGVLEGKRVSKRRYLVNNIPRQKRTFVGNLGGVTFRPDDLRLIDGSPGRRRRFMNEVLVQVSSKYRLSLGSYEKALRRRNKVLSQIRDNGVARSSLAFWDDLMVKHGGIIAKHRADLVDFLNLDPKVGSGETFRVEYDQSVISEARLQQYANAEVAAGHTLVGPHRDDLIVKIILKNKPRELSAYGSRGQQRMGVLWLKMGQVLYIKKMSNSKPVILLDDVFSELDLNHEKLVMGLVNEYQVLVTSTEVPAFLRKLKSVDVIDI